MTENSIELDMVSDVAGFCDSHAQQIEHEIERMGVVLGVNWEDEVQVRGLAKEALGNLQQDISNLQHDHTDPSLKARVTLFGLANMMLSMMARSAGKGVHTHGGPAWKAFSRALRQEQEHQGT